MSCTFWLMLKISTSGSSYSSFPSLIRTICNCTEYIVLYYTVQKFDFTVDEGKEWLNPSRDKNQGTHRRRKVD